MKEKIKRKKRAHVVMQWPFLQRQRFSPVFWGQTEFVEKKVNLKQEINRVYWLAKFWPKIYWLAKFEVKSYL